MFSASPKALDISVKTNERKDEAKLPIIAGLQNFTEDDKEKEKEIIRALPPAFQKYARTPKKSAQLFNDPENKNNEGILDKKTGAHCVTYAKWTWWKRALSLTPFYGWFFTTRIYVPQGSLGQISTQGKPEFLQPGWHILLDRWSEDMGNVEITQEHIKHGTAQIITVTAGQLACVLDSQTGEYHFLSQGKHVFESSTIIFKEFIRSQHEKSIKIDRKVEIKDGQEVESYGLRFERIEEGHVGIKTRQDGTLEKLGTGWHEIAPAEVYHDTISERLHPLNGIRVPVRSKEGLALSVEGEVNIRITDPMKAVKELGYYKNIETMIKNMVNAAFTAIIPSLDLNDINQVHGMSFYRKSYKFKLPTYRESQLKPTSLDNQDTETLPSTPTQSIATSSTYSTTASLETAGETQAAETKACADSSSSSQMLPPSAPAGLSMCEYITKELNNLFENQGVEIVQTSVQNPQPLEQKARDSVDRQALDKIEARTSEETAGCVARKNLITAKNQQDILSMQSESNARITEREAKAEANKIHILAEAEADKLEMLGKAEATAANSIGGNAADLRKHAQSVAALGRGSVYFTPNMSTALATLGTFSRSKSDGALATIEQRNQNQLTR